MNYTLGILIFSIGFVIGVGLYAQSEDHPFFEGSLTYSVEFKGEQANMLQQNEPNDKLLFYIKDADYIVQLKGGRYPKTFIFIADSNNEYTINFKERMAFKYSKYTDRTLQDKNQEKPIAQATGRQKEVQGILCDEYKMTTPSTIFYYYVNDAYRVNTAAYPDKPKTKASWLARGLEGRIPLETVKKQKGLVVKTTLDKAKSREFSKEQFLIPDGFKIRGRDYRF